MKKGLGLIGAGVLVGVTVYIFLSKIKKKNDHLSIDCEENSEDALAESAVSVISRNDDQDKYIQSEEIKSSVINTISARHEEASKIMKDAVDNIWQKSKVPADENRDLEEISEQLDELLREE